MSPLLKLAKCSKTKRGECCSGGKPADRKEQTASSELEEEHGKIKVH